MRGRKPKPAQLRIVEGNPGHRRVPEKNKGVIPGDLVCPTNVMQDERARVYWDSYLANTVPGHLAPADGPLLARLCIALSMADQATEIVQKTGVLIRSDIGPKQNPAVSTIIRSTETARKLASELCLTVAERSRVGAAPAKKDNPFANL